jgi:hypothetical protein
MSIYCSFFFRRHSTLCGLSINQTSPICLSSHLHHVCSVPGHIPFHIENLFHDSVVTYSYVSIAIVYCYLLILYGNYPEIFSVFSFSFCSAYVSCSLHVMFLVCILTWTSVTLKLTLFSPWHSHCQSIYPK